MPSPMNDQNKQLTESSMSVSITMIAFSQHAVRELATSKILQRSQAATQIGFLRVFCAKTWDFFLHKIYSSEVGGQINLLSCIETIELIDHFI